MCLPFERKMSVGFVCLIMIVVCVCRVIGCEKTHPSGYTIFYMKSPIIYLDMKLKNLNIVKLS